MKISKLFSRLMATTVAVACVSLCATANAITITTLMDNSTTPNGSFEDPPGADNVGSASWTDNGGNAFWSLNRSLGPGGPQDGAFSGVLNPGGFVHIQSTVISTTVNSGDVLDFTGYFAAQLTSVADRSDYALSLNFGDGQGDIDLSVLANTGADGGNFLTSPAFGTTATRVWLAANPNAWNQFGHQYTYSGPGATQVQVTFEARPRSQTYFDNFVLTQTVIPEPSSMILGGLALAGVLVSRRRDQERM